MTNMTKAGRALAIAIAGAFVLPVLPALTGGMSEARADGVRIRVGGSVRVRVGTPHIRVRHRRRYHRHYYRPRRVYVYGGYYSYRFASPPPPASYDCEPVPTYTTTTPAPVVTTAVVHREPLPRFGIGLSAGRFEGDDGRDADDFGVFARLRLTDALELELESAKTEHDAGDRLDKRLGGALYVDLAARSDWAPYVVGGLGVQKTEGDGGAWESERSYGEIGGGLRWRLNRNFTLAGDLRVGRSTAIDDDDDVVALTVLPEIPDEEDYTRLTLKGILYF